MTHDSAPDHGEEIRRRPEGGSPTGTPRWLKVLGIVLAALVLGFVIVMHLVGGGMRGH